MVTKMVAESTRRTFSANVDKRRDAGRGLLMKGRKDVGVAVQRDLDAGMAEPLLDHLWMNSSLQCERGVGVTEVVQADRR